MTLPRWTAYPAIAVLLGVAVLAVPRTGSSPENTESKRVVVFGIDGLDPDLLREALRRDPESFPNFRWLIAQGDGIQSLRTSTPPQSPVAWSNFITGLDPGGHGIFDFIHRDPITRGPTTSTTVTPAESDLKLPGSWKLPLSGDAPSNRSGKSFWTLLSDAGVHADIWRMPANFPVEPSSGLSFPGMMTPAVDSAYGEASFYTTDPLAKSRVDDPKAFLVTEFDGRIETALKGPANPFHDGNPAASVPITVVLDRENDAAAIQVDGQTLVLRAGDWSDFVPVSFDLLPMGLMSMGGMVRFYLRSLDPEFELYASPVNFDPVDPATVISEPEDASAKLASVIGRYYTQGMAEDVNALKKEILSDAEFMSQVDIVYRERMRMLDHALDNYTSVGKGGLFFFYVSTIDLASHMMWRHADEAHPMFDAELANEDSSAFSGRAGSKWKDVIFDLYRKMDPALGRIRERLGDDVTLIVMSDHGFAPYRRKFALNTWLLEKGYLVLKPGMTREPADGSSKQYIYTGDHSAVDWTRTRAYGLGFNGLYLNLKGRERDDPASEVDETGIVEPGAEADALLAELRTRLVAEVDPKTGQQPILRCDIASEVYRGARVSEAPDILVGYNAGYGNSDPSSLGRIPHNVLEDNTGGTFNGNHLMAPEVVAGILIANRRILAGDHALEDLTTEILGQYGVEPAPGMQGHRVLASK
ncbi:MAG: alkaline phosphatase family protein [Planctomycetota bacterium]